jgi:hypothetical protein
MRRAIEQLADLKKQLSECTGPKTRRPVEDKIKKAEAEIKGHVKEMEEYKRGLDKSGIEISDADWKEVFTEIGLATVAPMTMKMAREEGMPPWGTAAGALWDILNWVDPVMLTDLAEWLFLDDAAWTQDGYCVPRGTGLPMPNGSASRDHLGLPTVIPIGADPSRMPLPGRPRVFE